MTWLAAGLIVLAQSELGWNVLPDGRLRYCWLEWHPGDWRTDADDRLILFCQLVDEAMS